MSRDHEADVPARTHDAPGILASLPPRVRREFVACSRPRRLMARDVARCDDTRMQERGWVCRRGRRLDIPNPDRLERMVLALW